MTATVHTIRTRQRLRRELLVWLYDALALRTNNHHFERELAEVLGAERDDIALALWQLAGDGLVQRDGLKVFLTPPGATQAEVFILENEVTHDSSHR